MELMVCNFHNDYDGILDNNVLKQIKAIVNYANNTLTTLNKVVPLKFENESQQVYSFNTVGEYIVKIPVLQSEGLIYKNLEKFEDQSVEIMEGAYECIAGYIDANVRILDNKPKLLTFTTTHTEPINLQNFYVTPEKQIKPIFEQIRIDHLNQEEKQKLIPIIKHFKDIFYTEHSDLSFTHLIKHRIRTIDHAPISTKTYRYPYIHKKEVQEQIKEMLATGIIRTSYSPYSAPIWVVPKKIDGRGKQKWR